MRTFIAIAAVIALGISSGISVAYRLAAPPPANAATATHLQVRYANARLQLAQLNLTEALQINERQAGTVSETEIQRLRTFVDIAGQQLAIAKEFTHGSTVPIQLTAAEAAARLAEQDLDSAMKANEIMPGTVSEIRVQRLRVKLEMARLRVEMWRDPACLPSLIDEMQWQIDRLTEQVLELSQRLDALVGT